MTSNDLKSARKTLGLSQSALANALRLSPKNGGRTIRLWEAEGGTVPGPVQVAVEAMMARMEDEDGRGMIATFYAQQFAAHRQKARDEALYEAWQVALNEAVEAEDSHPEDMAYNRAVAHIAQAIRSLAPPPAVVGEGK